MAPLSNFEHVKLLQSDLNSPAVGQLKNLLTGENLQEPFHLARDDSTDLDQGRGVNILVSSSLFPGKSLLVTHCDTLLYVSRPLRFTMVSFLRFLGTGLSVTCPT